MGQERQGPFILSRTLNQLAKKVQTNLKTDINSSLKIRRKQFINNQVKIDNGTWALKTRLKVTIHLTDLGAFIGDFEEGGEHVPINGHTWLTKPNPKVFGNRILRADDPLRAGNLNLHDYKGNTIGNERTFLVHGKQTPLILQRTSPVNGRRQRGTNKATGVRLLYTLVKQSHRPMKIHWYDTSNATVQYEAEGIWIDVIRQALANPKH